MDALVVRRLEPFHANLGKRLVKSPKLYLRDSGLLHALLGVAEDEERHAALGWATLRWLLAGAGPALRAQAAAALEDGARAVLSGADAPTPSGAAAFGLLGGPDRQRLRARVVDAVVRPCMDALLGAAA